MNNESVELDFGFTPQTNSAHHQRSSLAAPTLITWVPAWAWPAASAASTPSQCQPNHLSEGQGRTSGLELRNLGRAKQPSAVVDAAAEGDQVADKILERAHQSSDEAEQESQTGDATRS